MKPATWMEVSASDNRLLLADGDMKFRMALILAGAAIGLCYLAAGIILLRWIDLGTLALELWVGMTVVGVMVNMIAATTWSINDDIQRSSRQLLLLQTCLPLAIMLAGVIFLCAPFVLLSVWFINNCCIGPIACVRACLLRRRLRMRLKASGRWMSWDALEPLLVRGEGVLIFDTTHCRPGLVWWTDDELLSEAGLMVLPDDRLRRISHDQLDRGVDRLISLSRFVSRYFDVSHGRALLTPMGGSLLASKKFVRAYSRVPVFAIDASQGRLSLGSRMARR